MGFNPGSYMKLVTGWLLIPKIRKQNFQFSPKHPYIE